MNKVSNNNNNSNSKNNNNKMIREFDVLINKSNIKVFRHQSTHTLYKLGLVTSQSITINSLNKVYYN